MKKGFTLVELLVALGVVAIVAGVGLTNLRGRNRDERVVESAEKLKQAFLQAKSQAQSGKKDCRLCGAVSGVCGTGDVPLLGWRVSLWPTTPPSYSILGLCDVIPFSTLGPINLSDGVAVNTSGGSSVLFIPQGLGTDLPGASMTVQVSATGIIRSFTIQKNGEIGPIQ
jgi:prepilin-type N-terminal cleavage/methylation domain-containing protein